MIETTLPLAPALWAMVPAPDQAPLLEQLATLRLENAALRAQNAALQEPIRELASRLGQDSSNSSRSPSSDPLQAPRKRPEHPSGRKRGGQPGHRGAFRALLPVEQVDEVVAVVPDRCRHCEQPFLEAATGRCARVWRHQQS
jgi:transposase